MPGGTRWGLSQPRRVAAVGIELVDDEEQLGKGVLAALAGVEIDDAGNLVGVVDEQGLEFLEDARTLGRRFALPDGGILAHFVRRRGATSSSVDIGQRAKLLAGRRIEEGEDVVVHDRSPLSP
jgi:hypothetical protein